MQPQADCVDYERDRAGVPAVVAHMSLWWQWGHSKSDSRVSEALLGKWLWEGTGIGLGTFCRCLPISVKLDVSSPG